MKYTGGHLNEEQLLDYRYGDLAEAKATVEEHLHQCANCRASYESLESVLAMVEALPVADPGPHFEARMWNKIAPKLQRPRFDWSALTAWMSPKRLIAFGTVAALIVVAFFAGRISLKQNNVTPAAPQVADNANANAPGQVRERILLVAVGDHLDRAQSVLLEISNAEPGSKQNSEVDISAQQERAQEMLVSNRFYRQTAEHSGDNAVASVLDELEPVLLEIAHSPSKVSSSELEELQRGIESRGLMLKIRVLDSTVRNKEKPTTQHSATRGS
ncbi:MAG TPA: hypothetical protein VIH72_07510 [Candidatus Acidoferrales bacterium]